jgi:DNA-binding response OmpR family regulator
LKGEGFEVDSFNDPHTPLSNFNSGIYDVVLIDVKMLMMDGFDLYRKLKNETHHIKNIFLIRRSNV